MIPSSHKVSLIVRPGPSEAVVLDFPNDGGLLGAKVRAWVQDRYGDDAIADWEYIPSIQEVRQELAESGV